MKSKIRKIITMLAAVVFVLSMTAPVFADYEPIEEGFQGSISLSFKDNDNVPIFDMGVRIFKVANVTGQTDPSAANGYDVRYVLTDEFMQFDEYLGTNRITGFSEQRLNDSLQINAGESESSRRERWQAIAATLAPYASIYCKPSGYTATDYNGRAEFQYLDPGLYLISIDGTYISGDEADYRYTYQPTWIMLPQYKNGIWNYDGEYSYNNDDVHLRPKYSYEAVTNEYSVTKRWVNDSNYPNARPNNISVDLYRDRVWNRTVILNEANNWTYSWTSPSTNWTAIERTVADGYAVSISQGKNGEFILTNTYNPPPPPAPRVYKKIMENNESGYSGSWIDGADYDIGDAIPFRLVGTVPDIRAFSTYYYRFNDTMDNTMELDTESVEVYLFTPSSSMDDYDVETMTDPGSQGTLSRLSSGFRLANNSANTAFQVIFDNLKDVLGLNSAGGQYIIVQFSARLLDTAVIGTTGNANEVYLTYTESPNAPPPVPPSEAGPPAAVNSVQSAFANRSFRLLGESSFWGDLVGDVAGTANTDKDEVVAYTWDLPVQKVDERGNHLVGARFMILYAPNEELVGTVYEAAKSCAGRNSANQISDDEKEYILKVREKQSGVYYCEGYYRAQELDVLDDTIMQTDDSGELRLTGVDQGYYFIVEYSAPQGCILLNEPVYVRVATEHNYAAGTEPFERSDTYVDGHVPDAQGDQLSDYFLYTNTNDNGRYTSVTGSLSSVEQVVITNNAIGSLPSTGGTGTAVIYIAGSALMAGAAAAFIRRRQRKGR